MGVAAASNWLIGGNGPATHVPQVPAAYPVPIHLGALTSRTVELAGELADGFHFLRLLQLHGQTPTFFFSGTFFLFRHAPLQCRCHPQGKYFQDRFNERNVIQRRTVCHCQQTQWTVG